MIDREKMTPGEWIYDQRRKGHAIYQGPKVATFDSLETRPVICYTGFDVPDGVDEANWQAIADLHNAWLIQMGLGWGVVRFPTGWGVAFPNLDVPDEMRSIRAADPATAILTAHAWWKENGGGKP